MHRNPGKLRHRQDRDVRSSSAPNRDLADGRWGTAVPKRVGDYAMVLGRSRARTAYEKKYAIWKDAGFPRGYYADPGMITQSAGWMNPELAISQTYGRDRICDGPVLLDAKLIGETIRLIFGHTRSGLVTRPENDSIRGFAVAGADRKFVWATATISGDTVIVGNPEIKTPKYVRYAWANNPVCNLYNKEGLPALPFRTDR